MRVEVDIRKLIDEALKVLPNSYAPYSNTHVAAAILTANGKIFLGVNVENASYGLTICAERVAVASAITHGEKNFVAVAIVSDTPERSPPAKTCSYLWIAVNTWQVAHHATPEPPHRRSSPLVA
jgi:cytidine deaminase